MAAKKEEEAEWAEIAGAPGYLVSNRGEVQGKRGKLLALSTDTCGYKSASLYYLEKKGTKTHFVHRLVAEAFIPNPQNKSLVHHLNGLRHDNRTRF